MKTILVDAIKGLINEDGSVYEEMYDLLEKYPNNKIVLTGANDDQFKRFKLDQCPYKVFTLKHNPEKSNPNYFKILLERFGLKSDEVIYFEHDALAVGSAKLLGIKAYFYDHTKKDLIELKKFIDSSL